MARTKSEAAREAETAAREAKEAKVRFWTYIVRDPTPKGTSDITGEVIEAIESSGWRFEHMTSRSGDGGAIGIHTLLFRLP
jgi:hypothetical protein